VAEQNQKRFVIKLHFTHSYQTQSSKLPVSTARRRTGSPGSRPNGRCWMIVCSGRHCTKLNAGIAWWSARAICPINQAVKLLITLS
jgi:hypothetical protein